MAGLISKELTYEARSPYLLTRTLKVYIAALTKWINYPVQIVSTPHFYLKAVYSEQPLGQAACTFQSPEEGVGSLQVPGPAVWVNPSVRLS